MLAKVFYAALDKLILLLRVAILVGIVALISAGGYYLLSHSGGVPRASGWSKTDINRDEGLQSKIKEFKMTERTAAEDKWTLFADVVYIKEKVKMMEGVKMSYHPAVKWGMAMELAARNAVLQNDTNDIEFTGDVALVTQGEKPINLKTETLRWSQGKRQLTSEELVRLQSRNAVITGRGLRIDMERKTFAILNSVQALF